MVRFERLALCVLGLTVMVNVTGVPLQGALFAINTLFEIKPLNPDAGGDCELKVLITILVVALMTDMVFGLLFNTYTRLPSGDTDIPFGTFPTDIVAATVFDAVFITDTLFDVKVFVT